MSNAISVLKVLLIDDDEDELLITRDLLQEDKVNNYKLDWVNSYEAGLKALRANQHDAYLLDYNLGNRSGRELLDEASTYGYTGPIIMLTGQEAEEIDLAALSAGAADFLVKGEVSTSLLSRSIRYAIERKRATDEIISLNEGLELRVTERTRELMTQIAARQYLEEQLRASLEKEKELSELKTRFISTTSHEFRTPLTSILSSSELLEHYGNQWSEEKKLEVLRRIQNSANKLTLLLDDILLVSRGEAGRIELKHSPIDLVKYCQNQVDELQSTARSKQLIIFNYTGLAAAWVLVDERLLGHILSNLLSNALKYSPGGGTVDFQLYLKEGKAIFKIRDEGIGIPTEDQVHLFEPFYRAKNTGTISGAGLGLTIVKRSIEIHGGEVEVESCEKNGTTFTVTLPLKQSKFDE